MKNIFLQISKVFVFLLAGAFLFSAFTCCCFVPEAKADPVPSCHQTTEQSTPVEADECECNDAFVAAKGQVILQNIHQFVYVLDHRPNDFNLVEVFGESSYKDPPQNFSSPPLYIKHANLRI